MSCGDGFALIKERANTSSRASGFTGAEVIATFKMRERVINLGFFLSLART